MEDASLHCSSQASWVIPFSIIFSHTPCEKSINKCWLPFIWPLFCGYCSNPLQAFLPQLSTISLCKKSLLLVYASHPHHTFKSYPSSDLKKKKKQTSNGLSAPQMRGLTIFSTSQHTPTSLVLPIVALSDCASKLSNAWLPTVLCLQHFFQILHIGFDHAWWFAQYPSYSHILSTVL